jgi:outer membrane protein assembly factor BamA
MVDGVAVRGANRVTVEVAWSEIAVQPTSIFRRWFGMSRGTITCLDSAETVLDARAIAEQYRLRGFPDAVVTPRVERHGDRRARIVYDIREGRPVSITRVTLSGLGGTPIDSAAATRRLLGEPMDDSVVTAVSDSLQALLRDAGHARAAPPTVVTEVDSVRRQGFVRLAFVPGPTTFIGGVQVRITPSGAQPILDTAAVRASFGLRPGRVFSASEIAEGQQRLAALDLYRMVRVDTASAVGARGASRDTIGIALSLAEGPRRRVNTSAGWGTLDCFRTQVREVEQDFLGLGNRVEFVGRLSKIGVAEPFDGFSSLCSGGVRRDVFSTQLNYYVGATLTLRGWPVERLRQFQPQLTVFSERRSSVGAYEQTTELGILATATHALGERLIGTLQYTFADARTRADRGVSCTRFGFCRVEDVASFLLRSPLHSVSGALAKNPLQPTDDPARGYRWTADLKFGHASVGRIVPIDFGKYNVEGAIYRPLASWLTLAARLQFAGVVAPADRLALLPPAERLFGGGQNSVRGYGQNLLGPGSYIVTAIDTVTAADGTSYGVAKPGVDPARIAPSGGNAMWFGNIELRTRRGWPTDLLHWVAFLDMGRVWNTKDVFNITNASTHATPGIGIRFVTALGPFRVDVGYNPNAAEAGPAFYVTESDLANGVVGRAICVSPGSTDPLGSTSSVVMCPATYTPPRARSFLSRLVFHFSLGNAF